MPRRTPKKIELKRNLIAYYIAIGVIVLGYIMLGIGGANSVTSWTLGPVIMVIGYLFAVPFALLSGGPKRTHGTTADSDTVQSFKD